MLLRPGDIFADCRILTLCGSGGMGVVYPAQDTLEKSILTDAEKQRADQDKLAIALSE